jgi:flagellar biogenesis protein FliO
MLGEFVTRLAIALPLVCGLAVLCLWAWKRGRLTWPAMALPRRMPAGGGVLDVLDVRALSPTARVAVIRFDGRTHLVGVSGQTISLLMASPEGTPVRAEDPQ